MADSQAFLSYNHSDDESEGGRISRLARDIVDQFEMITGDKINIFIDKDGISWGENWRDKIDSSLTTIAFFIPILSPRYFLSPECRRELQFFARQATRLGIKELVLPLLYVDPPSFHDDDTTDDLIKLVRTFQWEDWRELRFADIGSEEYRRGVARLATRLAEAYKNSEQLYQAEIVDNIEDVVNETIDESPGFIDRLASLEDTLPKWTETIKSITEEIEVISQIMKDATEEIKEGNAHGKAFAYRLIIARRVAKKLAEPTEQIWLLSNEFASQLHEVDEGYHTLIEQASTEVKEDPSTRKNICDFINSLRLLSASASEGLGKAQEMIDAISPLEKMSRDLRPVVRRLRQGLTIMVEARGVTDEWLRLIQSSDISCDDDGK